VSRIGRKALNDAAARVPEDDEVPQMTTDRPDEDEVDVVGENYERQFTEQQEVKHSRSPSHAALDQSGIDRGAHLH
jgi:hypothetical protein